VESQSGGSQDDGREREYGKLSINYTDYAEHFSRHGWFEAAFKWRQDVPEWGRQHYGSIHLAAGGCQQYSDTFF
jgi:hypothetical protein